MQERKELLRSIAERSLGEIITRKGGDTKKSVFENLYYLTTQIELFGEKRNYIPLATKEALARLVDPDVRYEYEVKFSQDGALQVICRLIWSDSDNPSGTGISTRYLGSIFKADALSDEDRKEKWVKTVMSLARADAIRDALSLSAYDFDESERQIKAEEEEIMRRKAEKAAKKPKKTIAEKPAPAPEPVVDAATEALPFDEEKVEEKAEKPAEVPVAEEPVKEVSDEIAAARETVADLGQFKGYKLGLIYDKNPKGLLWLINRGSAVAEQAKILVLADEELASKL